MRRTSSRAEPSRARAAQRQSPSVQTPSVLVHACDGFSRGAERHRFRRRAAERIGVQPCVDSSAGVLVGTVREVAFVGAHRKLAVEVNECARHQRAGRCPPRRRGAAVVGSKVELRWRSEDASLTNAKPSTVKSSSRKARTRPAEPQDAADDDAPLGISLGDLEPHPAPVSQGPRALAGDRGAEHRVVRLVPLARRSRQERHQLRAPPTAGGVLRRRARRPPPEAPASRRPRRACSGAPSRVLAGGGDPHVSARSRRQTQDDAA